ncbi:MAG: type I-E CRISPR-associated protein Cse1/CasA [Treponema sp.]|jgi:CRISPR system Cascade subunit CasA|nr:type I-E CRISPR-associated protein Cse1/CasA [Treponema sp.]
MMNGKTVNDFNLIDKPWIPAAGIGLIDLQRIFRDPKLMSLGGNTVQKVALLKLLLAICQAACTPENDEDWEKLGMDGIAREASIYLEKKHDCFELYGAKPFLQIPAIEKASVQSYGAVMPDIATGNTTILTQLQQEQTLTDADKAVLVVQLMGFALGGKKADNSIILSPNYQGKYNKKGKPSTGKPGASLGFKGYLHNFLVGRTLQETLYLNILTKENIEALKMFPQGLGPIPWETPPLGEDDEIARALKNSLMGRLVPFSYFVLLSQDGIHYSEGIAHPNHGEYVTDPSVAINASGKTVKVIWTDTSKRPWRHLTSLLGFLKTGTDNDFFQCPHLVFGINRGKEKIPTIGVWSGGLQLSNKAGEQYVSGTDDYVESVFFLRAEAFDEGWFYSNLKKEMGILDDLSKILFRGVFRYYKEFKEDGDNFAKKASELFWELCERKAQDLLDACTKEGGEATEQLRPYFLQCVREVYETYCPRETARQIEAWAKFYPYMNKSGKEKA